MNDPTKLPKWAQEHIIKIERERDTAIRALNEYVDNQTPSQFYVDEMESTGEEKGPSIKRRYVQTRRIIVAHAGIELQVYTVYGEHISLKWSGVHGRCQDIGLIPESFCAARIVAKENMR